METWLCKMCGTRIDASSRVCPTCGAINTYNPEVAEEAAAQIAKEEKSLTRFSNSFSIVTLVIGIALLPFHFITLVSGSSYLWGTSFVGAVSASMSILFSILGISQKEGTGYAVLISCSISLGMFIISVAF